MDSGFMTEHIAADKTFSAADGISGSGCDLMGLKNQANKIACIEK